MRIGEIEGVAELVAAKVERKRKRKEVAELIKEKLLFFRGPDDSGPSAML